MYITGDVQHSPKANAAALPFR